ncbi:PEP-CTERM sorting domain-containing protein [Haloferula sp. A504]|uniref:PEP-CTERM sorting domain-containing protein n=1 Tax=Haloferula sp. A504 TaxID=3373601 RepID=UPI0031C35C1F|nr:PEP-CTERM sorting domain-containing protein [Verrucomicrobiaceae bacterium E54]
MITKNVLIAALLVSTGAGLSQAAIVSINLTRSGAPTEAGFTNWESDDNNLPSNLSIAGLTLSAPSTGINSGTTLRSIDRGTGAGYAGVLPSLNQTWWGQREGSQTPGGYITIEIGGLSAGSYTFTSWHLDFNDQTGQMKIEFSDDDGASFTDVVSPFDLVSVTDDGATAPVVQSFNFTSTGADVHFRFTNTAVDPGSSPVSGVFPVVNGFELDVIPEPSSALVLGVTAGFGLLRRRRR